MIWRYNCAPLVCNKIGTFYDFGWKKKFLFYFVIPKLQVNSALHFKIVCYPKEKNFQNRSGDLLLLSFHMRLYGHRRFQFQIYPIGGVQI